MPMTAPKKPPRSLAELEALPREGGEYVSGLTRGEVSLLTEETGEATATTLPEGRLIRMEVDELTQEEEALHGN